MYDVLCALGYHFKPCTLHFIRKGKEKEKDIFIHTWVYSQNNKPFFFLVNVDMLLKNQWLSMYFSVFCINVPFVSLNTQRL